MRPWLSIVRSTGALLRTAMFAAGLCLSPLACGGAPFEVARSVDTSTDGGSVGDGGNLGDGGDAGPATPFVCGTVTCDASTQYCFVPTDPSRAPTCRAIPNACSQSPDCPCIEQHNPLCSSPSCTQADGITFNCGP